MTEIKRFLVQAFRVDDSAEITVLATDADEAWRTVLRHLNGTVCNDVLEVRMNVCRPDSGMWRHEGITETTQSLEPQRKELGTREQLGLNLRGGLNRHCDSKASSLVYLLIADPAYADAWSTYLDLAWAALCRLETLDRDDIAGALAGAVRAMGYLWANGSNLPNGMRQFHLALELLGHEDWLEMTFGLIDRTVTP